MTKITNIGDQPMTTLDDSITRYQNAEALAQKNAELVAELARLRAALEDQHASTDALWNDNHALRAELERSKSIADVYMSERKELSDSLEFMMSQRDALRARLQAVTEAGQKLVADYSDESDVGWYPKTAQNVSALRAALPPAPAEIGE